VLILGLVCGCHSAAAPNLPSAALPSIEPLAAPAAAHADPVLECVGTTTIVAAEPDMEEDADLLGRNFDAKSHPQALLSLRRLALDFSAPYASLKGALYLRSLMQMDSSGCAELAIQDIDAMIRFECAPGGDEERCSGLHRASLEFEYREVLRSYKEATDVAQLAREADSLVALFDANCTPLMNNCDDVLYEAGSAYLSAGRIDRAKSVSRILSALAWSPYGKVLECRISGSCPK
jgi:hypothetical protein